MIPPVISKSLHVMLMTTCTSGGDLLLLSLLLKRITHCFTVLTSTVWVPETFSKHRWMLLGAIFSHGEIQFHTFVLYVLPCQMSFCQTAPLLPSVTQLQHVTAYWWEGFNLYCHTSNVCLWHHGTASQNLKHYFQGSPHNIYDMVHTWE